MEVVTSKYCQVETFTIKSSLVSAGRLAGVSCSNNRLPGCSSDDTFHARFPNIFVDYPLGSMRVGDKVWTNWNKAPLRLWQTQLNFATWCTSSACGVSSEHLTYTKHPMVRSLYRFHVY